GLDDTPSSGEWSPSNTSGTDLVKVGENVYDGGGVGDGNLTQTTAIPCPPSRNVCHLFGGISLRNGLLPKRGRPPREGRTQVPTPVPGSPFRRRAAGRFSRRGAAVRPDPLNAAAVDSGDPRRGRRRPAATGERSTRRGGRGHPPDRPGRRGGAPR